MRLVQAVGNLVANALEHGAGPVRVRLHVTRGHVRIEVRDQGPGLPASVAALAGDAPHAGRRGHGLAVADRVIRRHGGRLADRAGQLRRLRRGRAAPRGRGTARSGGPRRAPAPSRPAAALVSRRRRAFVLLGLALVLGGLAASDVARREAAVRAQLGPVVDVVVARAELAPGERLAAADLASGGCRGATRPWRPAAARVADRRAARRRRAARGRRRRRAARARADVAGPPVREGERAAEVVGLGAPALIVPGARVDVLVTRDGEGGAAAGTELALEDVEVLTARPAPAGVRDDGAERVAATLRVSVDDAVYLAAAQSFAREVRLLPRATGDRGRTGRIAVGPGLR